MDTLTSLFPIFISKELVFLLVSVTLAAVVFFFFIHLLRKEESDTQADHETPAAKVGAPAQQQA